MSGFKMREPPKKRKKGKANNGGVLDAYPIAVVERTTDLN